MRGIWRGSQTRSCLFEEASSPLLGYHYLQGEGLKPKRMVTKRSSTVRRFRAILERPRGRVSWTVCRVPFDVVEAYGARGHVPVRGKINGVPFRTTLVQGGPGVHFIVVNREMRDKLEVARGDVVRVEMQLDPRQRKITIPADFLRALARDATAKAKFTGLPPSHQKRYVEYIAEAKRPETRRRRIQDSLRRLRE
ncbi:MAG: YdeI/OmpD-associated family protein [Anaerolineales bacterium]